jgi:TatD DNase family protein
VSAPNLVDSHCHLNFEPLISDLALVLQRARDNGVGQMLCVSVNLETFPEILALARTHAGIYASVGVHPNERTAREPDTKELVDLSADPRVLALGETGLDYYRSNSDMSWQQERFRHHIRAARRARKPLIIHMRQASEDTLHIMQEEEAGEAGGVMHCFTEDWNVARRALDLGFYISFSGIVTFANAVALRDVARQIPDDRLLLETDAPYLAPVPHRGKTNEPAFVRDVAANLAEVRRVSLEQLADMTTGNFRRLFKPRATESIDS